MSTDTLLIFSWIASYPDHGYRSISATPACGWAIRARVRITDRTQTNCLNQKKKKTNKKGRLLYRYAKKGCLCAGNTTPQWSLGFWHLSLQIRSSSTRSHWQDITTLIAIKENVFYSSFSLGWMTFLHHSSAMFVHWSKFQKRVVCLLVLSSIGTKKRKLDMSAVMSGYKFPTLAWEEGGGGRSPSFWCELRGL